jgi:acyl-coenzyme A thioesterase PaaI-like protein
VWIVRRVSKSERHQKLQDTLKENPFCTDAELAERFGTSVQTIRLDRAALNIPELRKRTKIMAENTVSQVKSLSSEDMVGDLIDLDLNESGISVLETTEDMLFSKGNVVKGHYIFSHAASLAIAIIDADVVLIGLANIKFKRPVYCGERLVAKAQVIREKTSNYVVQVITKVNGEQVFRGKFVVFMVDNPWDYEGEDNHDPNSH